MIGPLHTHAPHPCSFSFRSLPVCKPYEPCQGRCVATPPSTAYRFFYPTASPPEHSSSPSLSSPESKQDPCWFQNETSPLSTYHRKLQGHTSVPNSNLTREPETLQTNPPRPLTLIRLPCLPARSETSARRGLGSLIDVQIEELISFLPDTGKMLDAR